jgi:hypothetical protein
VSQELDEQNRADIQEEHKKGTKMGQVITRKTTSIAGENSDHIELVNVD